MRHLARFASIFVLLLAGPALATAAEKENGKLKSPVDERGLERLQRETGARVSFSRATGAVRFVSIDPGAGGDLMAAGGPELRAKSKKFLDEYAGIFGLRDGRDLVLGRDQSDDFGGRHLSYYQTYRGVPVFAAVLRTHFDAAGALTAVNGTVIPDIDLVVEPSRAAEDVSGTAMEAVRAGNGGREVFVRSGLLVVYRAGLARGVPGENHLAWQFEIGNGTDIREFVYVDAHNGKIIDRLPGIFDAMTRRAYDGDNLPTVPPSYPGSPFWQEGQPFPTGNAEADNMLTSSRETYDLYFKAFGRDSFDGAGRIMDSIFQRGYDCPNASWNGLFISFCPGLTTDDVTGHEWTHAYTEFTDGLIYEAQSGALNESYSDIFGETIDRINGRGTDTPDIHRTAEGCSVFGGAPPPEVTVTGGSAAGTYPALASVAEPPLPLTVPATDMALSNPPGACTAVTGVSGKIAVVDWTLLRDGTNECGSVARSTNAFNAGAVGVIFVAPEGGLLLLTGSASIATVEVTHEAGEIIKAGLPAQATFGIDVGNDPSVRWMVGEDDTAQGLTGPLRDMWNPRCFGNPGKVSDTFEYVCDINNDGGGVHTNSGIPNHAYALLVDGGTYNGQTIAAIGLTKAAHIYFRAMNLYLTPSSDFTDAADALERAATDLIGVNLKNLSTGNPSGQKITQTDVAQVHKAMLAVEMRLEPPCNFGPPILGQQPPALCPAGQPTSVFTDGFENPATAWSVSHEGTTAEFTERNWTIVGDLPDARTGKAFFAIDPDFNCLGAPLHTPDETALLHLDSPSITIPAGSKNPRLTFVHWFGTEAGFDGGNLKINVNGRGWQIIKSKDFVYNAYNAQLLTAQQGNTNPIAGQAAFSGTDDGTTGGSWGRSIIDLTPYAKAGDQVRLRFDFGNDVCAGRVGWYVDDVSVYRCP